MKNPFSNEIGKKVFVDYLKTVNQIPQSRFIDKEQFKGNLTLKDSFYAHSERDTRLDNSYIFSTCSKYGLIDVDYI